MEILVVGSVALDSIKTPFGEVEGVLGGSSVYFSVASSYFVKTNLLAVVGEDFPEEYLNFLQNKNIDLTGLQRKRGKTFRWKGSYDLDLSKVETLETSLNVFEDFHPQIPLKYQDSKYIFLANIDPELQLKVLEQVENPALIVGDTMNFWIEKRFEKLKEMIKRLDILIINEAEAREFTKETNLIKALQKILSLGPKIVVVKQGSYGALMFNGSSFFSVPAYPLEAVLDPTGAGDSFAGGLLGHLARTGSLEDKEIRRAIIFGSVMASFAIEDFGLNRLKRVNYKEIEARFKEFKELTHFEDI